MFTLEQIKAAHSKVKSGADFPAYIREIKALGVTHYEAFVKDGHMEYHGFEHDMVKTPARYEEMAVERLADPQGFKEVLLAHQQGRTDFPQFIARCAQLGVDRWRIDMTAMTCTYFDGLGGLLLVEPIPA